MARFGACSTNDPYISSGVQEDLKLRPQLIIHSPSDEFSTLTRRMGVAAFRLHCFFFSPMTDPWITCFIWSEYIHSFLRLGQSSTSWYEDEYSYFLFIHISQSCPASRIKKGHNKGIRLHAGTCRPSQLTETYLHIFHFNIIRWLRMQYKGVQ